MSSGRVAGRSRSGWPISIDGRRMSASSVTAADRGWLETILQRMVDEAAVQRPGQLAVLSRMTEVLFVEVLRSWIKSLGRGEGGWLGAIADRHIGKALQLIHEYPEHPWTLG